MYILVGNIIEKIFCFKFKDYNYFKLKCLKRKCKDCGVFSLFLLLEEKDVGNYKVKWKWYECVN